MKKIIEMIDWTLEKYKEAAATASYLDNVAFNAVILPTFKFMRLAP